MRVLKFGGSSVGTPDAVRKVIEIVRKKRKETPIAVVVSAFQGVTDLLTEAAVQAASGNEEYLKSIRDLEARHVHAIKDLVCVQNQSSLLTRFKLELNQMEDILQGISLIREITPKTMDVLLGFGERFSAMILAGALNDHKVLSDFVDARELIRTDDNHGQARVLVEPTWSQIQSRLRDPERVQVVTGFIAATDEGIPTTLGRGGSDYTAALIGAALEVDVIEIWTDVDGMMTADPGKVKRAFSIEEVSYEEAMEMSHFGARVIYPPTIQPALKAGIPIQIKNTFAPDRTGTLITKDAKPSGRAIKGLSSIDEVALITIKGSGMIGVSGIAARLFTTLAREKINILLITQASSEHTVTLAVLPKVALKAEMAIRKEFQLELHEEIIDDVLVEPDLSVIAIVGDHMRQIPGIAGRVFSALGRNGINIVAIAQGSSERNISFVIRRKDQSKAMNTLHDAFFLAGVKTVNLFLVGVGLIGGTLLRLIQNQVDT
ncbi:MAG: aspartate kinase, partial [Bacteroidota bacterium]